MTAIVAALLIFSTVQRNKVWETTFTLWQDCVLKAPNKARPRYNLGNAYFEEGMKLRLEGADGTSQFRNAIKRFKETLRIQKDYEDAMCNLGVSHAELDEHDQSIKTEGDTAMRGCTVAQRAEEKSKFQFRFLLRYAEQVEDPLLHVCAMDPD